MLRLLSCVGLILVASPVLGVITEHAPVIAQTVAAPVFTDSEGIAIKIFAVLQPQLKV